MKKNIQLITCAIFLCALFFFSCSKKDSSANNSIVGSWVGVSEKNVVVKNGVQQSNTTTTYDGNQTILNVTFTTDNKYSVIEKYSPTESATTTGGTYVVSGNKLNMVSNQDGSTSSATFSITDNILTMVSGDSYTENGNAYQITATNIFKR